MPSVLSNQIGHRESTRKNGSNVFETTRDIWFIISNSKLDVLAIKINCVPILTCS